MGAHSLISREQDMLGLVSIVAILAYLGYEPVGGSGRYRYYLPPWSDGQNASLVVDLVMNRFVDHSEPSFHGGNVNLVMNLGGIDRMGAMEWISDVFVAHREAPLTLRFPPRGCIGGLHTSITEVASVGETSMRTIQKHHLDVDFVSHVCKEVTYVNHMQGSSGCGLGLPNVNGGYSIIGGLYVGPNGYSFIPGVFPAKCLVFLSGLDYLSYASAYGAPTEDVIVLNSDAFARSAAGRLGGYELVTFFLKANGNRQETERIIREAAKVAIDGSLRYEAYGRKTFHEYYSKDLIKRKKQ